MRDPVTGQFVQGVSGNPNGRPKGCRNKLGEQFLLDLQTLWESEGADVLREARAEKPMEFAKMVAGLLPKELLVRRAPEEDMTDSELDDTIGKLEMFAAELRRLSTGQSATHSGSGTAN